MSSSKTFIELANPAIRDLIPYQPGKPIEEVERELGLQRVIKLASNENASGVSPKALLAAQQALAKTHVYPVNNSFLLQKALSDHLKIKPNQLTLGNGSENILELIIKAYSNANNNAIISQYTFEIIPMLLKISGAQIITIPTDGWRHDIQGTIQACNEKTRLIFVVNPNNPTGTYNTQEELNKLLTSIPQHVLVIIDEAYNEYILKKDYPNAVQLLHKHPNVIIARTFSKIYGLAGLRIGYAISSASVADILNRARLPFNVNSIGAAAAVAALSDQEHIQKSMKLNQEGRQQLETGFKKLGIPYIPSLGNFITMDVQKDAKAVYQALLHKGIIIRPLTAYGMLTHLRVTIGTHRENEMFLAALEEVLK